MNRIFLLDKSGSMHERIADAIGGFNSFVEEQKKIDGTLTLYTFNDKLTCEYTNVDIQEVKPMDRSSYVPGGNTALYDAMGHVLNDHDVVGKLIILTDGEENSSRHYTKSHVKDLIKHSKLEIIYAGADIEDAKELGIANRFHYDGSGTPEIMRLLSTEVSQNPY